LSKYEYTEDMVKRMHEVCAGSVTEEKIESLMVEFSVPRRSITAKLRKEGFDVPKKPAEAPTFSESETQELVDVLTANSGVYTAEELAVKVAGGKFTARQITGKALSLEMTAHIKPAEKKVAPRTYTEAEEGKIRELVAKGKFLEDIADAVGKTVNSVRGKLLSMDLKAPQRDKKDAKKDAYEGIDELAPTMSVAELVKHYEGKSERGIKTVLARRKLSAKDYTPKTVEK
jgi:hypothetical protein